MRHSKHSSPQKEKGKNSESKRTNQRRIPRSNGSSNKSERSDQKTNEPVTNRSIATTSSVRRGNGSPTTKNRSNSARSPYGDGFGLSTPGAYTLFADGQESDTGIVVNEFLALNLASVWANVNHIDGALSTMPVRTLRTEKSGSRTVIDDHPVTYMFNVSPDDVRTAVSYREAKQAHTLMTGNGCSEIIRNGRGQGIKMHLQDPRSCTPYLDPQTGDKKFRVGRIAGQTEPLRNDQVFHVPGFTWDGAIGISVLKFARDSFGMNLGQERYNRRFYKKNGMPVGFLVTPNTVPENKRKEHKKEWYEMYDGFNGVPGVGLLSGGMDWKPIGISPEDAEFLGQRAFQREEVDLWFNMYVTKPNDKVDMMMLMFAIRTLLPWVKRWENEAKMKLFTRVESLSFDIKFDMSGLLRADFKALNEVLKIMLQCGVITINEWRDIIDRNAFPELGNEPLVMASQLATLKDVEAGKNENSPLKNKNQPGKDNPETKDGENA